MTRRIFRDIEEAIGREVRRITFHNQRTESLTALENLFDPFTGEIIEAPVQPRFYDSSADAHNTQYPHIFVKLLKTREDRFTGRVIPPYGQDTCITYNENAPRAYSIIFQDIDGTISSLGNTFKTSSTKVAKIQAGYLLRLLTGNNKGTYRIASVNPLVPGPHEILVSNAIKEDLPEFIFDASQRKAYFSGEEFLTVKVGDNFTDSTNTTFPITNIDVENNTLTLGGTGNPDASVGASIVRVGNVFTVTETSNISFLVLDPNSPITSRGQQATSSSVGKSPSIPIDAYYLVRIDSKERSTHVDILNRVWEEFNPPRTALPVVIRTKDSFEQLLTESITSGGSATLNVSDNTGFNIGDSIYIIDNIYPSKGNYGFDRPFETTIIGKVGNTQVITSNTIPDTFTIENETKIISNAVFKLFAFHFQDHTTRDVESAQYWVHEFTFLVQLWIERLETPAEYDVILDISTPIEDLQGITLISDR